MIEEHPDPNGLDTVIGKACVLCVALALFLVVKEVCRVVLVDRPLSGCPMYCGDEIIVPGRDERSCFFRGDGSRLALSRLRFESGRRIRILADLRAHGGEIPGRKRPAGGG